ncbi:MAG: DNA-directed RNA polymerase subunit omega [Clostridia bacterium]|nr:DNA-directed RNA polymerase subunit omega [Clostridia bacterium]MBO7689610.1 DNA-directed RNA polymerase subunit omega [Clostridia bacterium]MBP5273162.1 DNA-directed RNA polymerase subunit omega [Clostridia bacterium]
MADTTFNPDLKNLLEGEAGEKNISRYSLVSATAKLAREISDEANMEGEILTEKPVSMALEKLLDGEYTIEEPLEIRDL